MTELIQSLVRGLGTGSVYALLALGFVIIYKSTLVISFAQPAMMVAGTVLVAYLVSSFGLSFYLAVLIGIAATAVLALVVERLALRPMVGEPVFVVAIITLGVDIVIRVVANRFIGNTVRQVGDPWGLSTLQIGDVFIQQRYLVMIVTTAIVFAALLAFFKFTRIGLAMRATAFDQETALAQGIAVGTVFALSWAIAGGMAALAGVFLAGQAGVDQQTWIVALKALPAIILGGLDSITGAIVGGVAVGIVESLFGTYQSAMPWLGNNFSVVSPYVLMLLVLLVRPYGLFGTAEVRRV